MLKLRLPLKFKNSSEVKRESLASWHLKWHIIISKFEFNFKTRIFKV